MREVEAFSPIRVVRVGLSVIGGGLIRQDGFRAVAIGREPGPDPAEVLLQRIHPAVPHLRQGAQRAGIIPVIHLDHALVGLGGPRRHATDLPIPRARRQQVLGFVEIGQDGVHDCVRCHIRLVERRVVLGVVGDVLPQPPGFEVIVRPQEQGLAPDAILVGLRNLIRVRFHDRVQQVDRGIGADHPFITVSPHIVQVVLGPAGAPIVEFDVRDGGLVGGLGPLVGVIAGGTAPHPVAGGASPGTADSGIVVQNSIGGNE